MDIDKMYDEFKNKYSKSIPPNLKNRIELIDIVPLLSYFDFIKTNGIDYKDVIKLNMYYYYSVKYGYVIRIMNRFAHRKYKKFYIRIFPNKRRGKRYVFALTHSNKAVLVAILTHISSYKDKHSKNTVQALQKALVIFRKSKNTVFDIRNIDKYVFSVIGTGKYANAAKINWKKIYKLANMINKTFKG